MARTAIALLLLMAGTAIHSQPAPGRLKATAAAQPLFERDWVLMNWALRYYDTNHDILLQPDEAQAAAQAFRQIADGDHDGRVTPEEYRSAREQILAHD